jgi:PAS domain S-box-containing protein
MAAFPQAPTFMPPSGGSDGESLDLHDIMGLQAPVLAEEDVDDLGDAPKTSGTSALQGAKKNSKDAPLTEDQLQERRERNREHAKRSRVRKRFLLESLAKSVRALQEENEKLRSAIRVELKEEGEAFINTFKRQSTSIIATSPNEATKMLDSPDYSLVKALQTAQQNFVITDPALPDNPIVYASEGFLSLTGYLREQVLGRNCRFLQGPETDPRAVDQIRKGIENGEDTTVVLLNYRVDGTKFWNQFFVAPLRDGDGRVMNHLGVQCKVSQEYAEAWHVKA